MKKIIKSKHIFCCVLSIIVFTGCHLLHTPKTPLEKEYEQIQNTVKQWTRSGNLYRDFETIAIVTATYNNLDVKKIYLAKYAQDHSLTREIKDKMLLQTTKELNENINFFVSIYAGDDIWNDFAKEDSSWSVYLINDKGEKVKVENIKKYKGLSVDKIDFYPHITPWKSLYDISFPLKLPDNSYFIKPDSKSITMQITGALGKIELTWPTG
ncbi:MAG: hypothetical protein V1872_01765 [bacterium]